MSKDMKRKNVMTKHKHVIRDAMVDYSLPEDDQQIVQILSGKGNYLHEAINANSETFLISMPTKFRHNLWIKKGDFVVIQPIEEGDKVRGEIIRVLFKEDIRYIHDEGKWPFDELAEHFEEGCTIKASKETNTVVESGSDTDSSCDDDLFVNTNRPVVCYEESSDSEESGSDSDETECASGESECVDFGADSASGESESSAIGADYAEEGESSSHEDCEG